MQCCVCGLHLHKTDLAVSCIQLRKRILLVTSLYSTTQTTSSTMLVPTTHLLFHFLARYFTFVTECKNPKACTILLRGASKDVLNEVERNLQDAMNAARNVMMDPYLVPGGGAVEMALSHVSLGQRGPVVGKRTIIQFRFRFNFI